jgi:hypothetical protein
MLARSNPEAARELLRMAQGDVERQWCVYANRAGMAGRVVASSDTAAEAQSAASETPKGGRQ